MRDDPIGQLLSRAEADMDVESRVDARELAERVRRRHRRRMVVARAAVVLIVVGSVGLIASVQVRSRAPVVASVESIRRELADLDAEAARHERAALVLASVKLKPTATARAADPQLWLDRQRREAAQAIVRTADRLYSVNRDPVQAAAEYRRAIRLFPDTSASATASQRLERLPS